MKRFNLILSDDLYEDFYRFFGARGIRQALLRRAVTIMVERAKHRLGEGKRPWWWTNQHATSPIEQVLGKVTERELIFSTISVMANFFLPSLEDNGSSVLISNLFCGILKIISSMWLSLMNM